MRGLFVFVIACLCIALYAQNKLYHNEFPLQDVTLTGGMLKKAQDLNIETLLQYDCDRHTKYIIPK